MFPAARFPGLNSEVPQGYISSGSMALTAFNCDVCVEKKKTNLEEGQVGWPGERGNKNTLKIQLLGRKVMTNRDSILKSRDIGGGIRMRNTCKSMADSCQCMTKPTTIL